MCILYKIVYLIHSIEHIHNISFSKNKSYGVNRNDRNALHDIAREAKDNIRAEKLTVMADKGFHNAREIEQCHHDNIQTIVAPSENVNSNDHGTTEAYLVSKFTYNKASDTYTCPQGHKLYTSGKWHTKKRDRDSILFKKYRTPKCNTCPVKHLCTGRAKGGREIERSQYAPASEKNLKHYEKHKELYKRRQMMNSLSRFTGNISSAPSNENGDTITPTSAGCQKLTVRLP